MLLVTLLSGTCTILHSPVVLIVASICEQRGHVPRVDEQPASLISCVSALLCVAPCRDMLWKSWQKAPENPLNQAAAAAQQR